MKYIFASVALLTFLFTTNIAKAETLEKVFVTFGFADYAKSDGTYITMGALGPVDGWRGARAFVVCDREDAPVNLTTPSMIFLVRDSAGISHWLGTFSLKDSATCRGTVALVRQSWGHQVEVVLDWDTHTVVSSQLK